MGERIPSSPNLDNLGILIYEFPNARPPMVGVDISQTKTRFGNPDSVLETEISFRRDDVPLTPEQLRPEALTLKSILDKFPGVKIDFYTNAVYATLTRERRLPKDQIIQELHRIRDYMTSQIIRTYRIVPKT